MAMDQEGRQSAGTKPAAKPDAAAARQRQSSAEPESPEYDKKTDGPNRPSV